MPNFPSIYLELQELWKRIGQLKDISDSQQSQIYSLSTTCPSMGSPTILSINDETVLGDEIPITSCFIVINYQRNDNTNMPPLQTENISIGQRLIIMSSLQSDGTAEFHWSPHYLESSRNIYWGNVNVINDTTGSIYPEFKPGDISELIYIGDGYWRMLSFNKLIELYY